jgi:steroid delta-isomerase-like uncharacterized protein
MSEPTTEQFVEAYETLWDGEYDRQDIVGESVLVEDPARPEPVRGREALLEHVRESRASFPDLAIRTEDLVAEGDTVMWEWRMTGTNEGELQGLPPTGNEVDITGMSKLVVVDGRLEEEYMYYNVAELFSQLGLD